MGPCIDKLLVIMYVVRFMQLESVTCMVIICVRYILSYNYVDGGLMHDMIRKAITVKPLITDPLKSGQPLYSNWFYHTTNTLQTSEKRTPLNFEQPASHRKAITPYFSWSGHLHHCHHYQPEFYISFNQQAITFSEMLFFVWFPISHQLLFCMNRTSIVINVSYKSLLGDDLFELYKYRSEDVFIAELFDGEKKKTLRSSQDLNLGLLNAGQMLLSTSYFSLR